MDPDRPPLPYIYFPPVHGIELLSDDIEPSSASTTPTTPTAWG